MVEFVKGYVGKFRLKLLIGCELSVGHLHLSLFPIDEHLEVLVIVGEVIEPLQFLFFEHLVDWEGVDLLIGGVGAGDLEFEQSFGSASDEDVVVACKSVFKVVSGLSADGQLVDSLLTAGEMRVFRSWDVVDSIGNIEVEILSLACKSHDNRFYL